MTVGTKLTPQKREKFLETLSETGNITKSAELVGVSRIALYKLKDRDEEFAEAWEEARKLAADALEDEAWRRGKEGIQKPLSYQGQLTGDIVQEYSDTLLIFLLKGNKPEKFKDRMSHDGNIKTENTVIYLPDNGRK
jgi:hypothetical protein